MIFDTHAHYYDKRFSEDRDDVLKDLKNHDISYVLNAGCDLKTSQMSILLADEYDFMYASVGFHPHEAKHYDENSTAMLENMAKHEKVVAIGEIGLDYYYDNSDREIQREVFAKQLQLAKKLNLPVIVHDRDAHKDCLDIILQNPVQKLVYHCYSGSVEYAFELVKLGYKMSFGGTVTFNNAKVSKEVIKAIPMDNIMLETDCPYLTPVPHRGKRNDSRYLNFVAEEIAKLRGITYEEVCTKTTKTALEFFDIK